MANSKRECKQCKEWYRVSPDQPSFVKWCSDKCRAELAIAHLMKNRENQAKSEKRVARKAAQRSREELKDLKRHNLAWQHERTQIVFNKLRVLEEKQWFISRGREPACISCGKTNMDWCCGHFRSRGASGELRYDPKNAYLQCNRYCNLGLSGNIAGNKTTKGYKQGLIERFGVNVGDAIIAYCEANREVKKWEWQELEEMRKNFNEKIRELEK